jgi:NADH-quinone oxidoreductase subunit H
MYEVIEQLLNGTLGLGAPEWVIMLTRHLWVVSILLAVAPLQMLFLTYFERRVIARIQDRVGPNRVGYEGLLQPVADGIKMFTKEDIVPATSDKIVHLIAPMVVVAPTMLMFAVVPWGPGMVPMDMNSGMLFFFAASSVSAVGLLAAGWASNNKFALLGAMRAVAQMVSYEIPALLSLLVVVMLTGSMSLVTLINAQGGLFISVNDVPTIPDWGLGWFVFTPVGFVAFLCFFIAALAEGERTPFDIPEADSEIVAGYMTEYSGMKFGLFYLAQYVLNFLLCGITVIVFFGGWQFPGIGWLAAQGVSAANPEGNPLFNVLAGVAGVYVFLAKTYLFFFLMVALRGALPRLRIDQLMDFGWKFLIPITMINIVSAALWLAMTQWGALQGFGFMENLGEAGSIMRWGAAFVVTLVINLAAFVGIARLTMASNAQRPTGGDRPAPLAAG